MSVDALRCKRCGVSDSGKSGLARGRRRYRGRACGCRVTDTPRRGKPPAMKALAVLLYGMGGMGFSMTGRVLGAGDVAVLKWVRAEAASLPEPGVSASVQTVGVGETWHLVEKACQALGVAGL